MSRGLDERLLVFLLRFGGGVMLLAWLAMLLPTDWMAWSHRRLGLGEFPDVGLTQYLTRSLSGLYAIHGGLLLVLSRDVRRFAPALIYVGWMNVVFGVAIVGIDFHAGMPWWWTAGEGPPVIGMGVLILVTTRSVAARDAVNRSTAR